GKSMNKALEHSKSMMLDTNDAWSLDDHEVLYHLQFCRGEDAKRAGPKPGFGMVPLLKSLFQLEATWEKQQKHYSKKFPNKPTERRRWRRGRVWDDITGVALALAKRTLKDNGEDSQGVSKLIIRGLRDSSSPITSILESLSYIATELRIKSNKIVWHSSPIPMNLENQAHADVSDGRDHQIILSEGEPTNVQDLLIQREKMLFEETLRVVGCLDRDTTVKVAGLVNPLLTSYRYLSEMLIRCLSDHKQFGLNVRGQIKYSGARSIYEAFSQGCYVFFRALGLGIPLRSNTWEGLHTLGHLKHTKQYKIGKKACYEYEWTDCIKSPDVLRSRLVFKLSEIFNRFTSKRIGKVAFRTDQYNIEYYEDIKLAHLKRKRTRSTDQWEGVPGSIRRGFIITGETLQGDRVPVYPIPLFIEYKEGSTFYQGTHPDILLSREKICRHLKSSPLALEKAKQFFGKINELNTEYFDSETVHERFREIERQLGDQFKALFKLVSKHHIALDSVIDRAKTRQILAMLRMVTGQSWMTQHGTTADTGLEQVERASVLSHVNGLGFPISIANSYLTMPSEFWCSAIGPAADLMTSELLDSFARHCDMSDDYEVENYMLAVGPTSGQGTQADTILGFADDSISQI
ncbi:hypothetical protein KAU87_05510, partial [Candidatus Bathyarchaeota archaeon]|nr:hypothetical protein [Candidatus Bathyarchaeota archaeon]